MQIDDWVFAAFCAVFVCQLATIIHWLRRAAKALESGRYDRGYQGPGFRVLNRRRKP